MQKLQQIFITGLIVLAAIGTGKLISHMGNFSTGSIKTEVTASSEALAETQTAAIPETPPTETAIIDSSTATPETAPIQSPTPATPITESTSLSATSATSVPSSTITTASEKDEVKEIKKAEEIEKEVPKSELTVKEKREARLLAEKNKKESEKDETEPQSSTSTEIEKKAEVTASADESKEAPITEPAPESAQKPAPAPVPTTNQQNEDKKEKLAKLKKMKNQPKLNKKILETIQAMRIIPDLFKQMGIVKDNGEKVDKKRPQNSLEIFTELIKVLTSDLQENTLTLEEMLSDIYEAQETQISHGRCISATYFTYSDVENSCIMISRKICRTKDITPDNRYDTIESCKADHGLVEKVNESREVLAFKKQKEEYLEKLTTLQIAYKYYSVRWEELVDLVQDATDFDTLGTAGNALNRYRMEQGETGKSDQETTSTPDSTQLSPLPAASIE